MLCSGMASYGQLLGWHVSSNGRALWAVGAGGLILHSEDGGGKWIRKKIETKQNLAAVFATADGTRVWVAAMTDEPNRLTGILYQSSDAGEHWVAVPGMSVPVDYLTGTPDGKHLWAIGTYMRQEYHEPVLPKGSQPRSRVLTPATDKQVASAILEDARLQSKMLNERYGQKLYHLVDGALESQTESPVRFDRFRHGIASSDDGVFLSGFGNGGMSVLCSVDGGKSWKDRADINALKLRLYAQGGHSATATPDGQRIALTDGLAAFYSPDAGASWLAKPLGRGGFDLLWLTRSELWLLSQEGAVRKVRLTSFEPLRALGSLAH
jgi:photosystem II stability/assembly factor-like uncharacterized protein